jgi:hypothetical protein
MTTIYNVDREGERATGYKLGRFKFKISKTENSVVFGAGGYFDSRGGRGRFGGNEGGLASKPKPKTKKMKKGGLASKK